MDYGHTNQTNQANPVESELALRQRAKSLAKSATSSNQAETDIFESAITPGVGMAPAGINPEPYSSINLTTGGSEIVSNAPSPDRSSQLNLGARALEPIFPPSNDSIAVNPNEIANYDPTASTEISAPAMGDTMGENQSLPTGASIEKQASAPLSNESVEYSSSDSQKPSIKVSQQFVGHNILSIENAIRASGKDVSALYELVQNTREELQ